MGGMVGFDALVSRDLKKPAKNKKRTNESEDNSNEKDEDHLYDRAGKSESEDTLREMCLAGMNVARLNFSHGTHQEHQVKIETVKKVRDQLELPIAIMLDTKGPEYRVKTFEEHKIQLNDGDTFIFTSDDCVGDQERVSVSYKDLAKEMRLSVILFS